MTKRHWFAKGLRFECTGCGQCCTGAPGYVWVNSNEILAIAKTLRLSAQQFEATYVRRVGARRSLIEYDNGDCVFFDPERRQCLVYQFRPRQCRTWPFWESTASTLEDWQETCGDCPGCGKGPLFPPDEIVRRMNVIRV